MPLKKLAQMPSNSRLTPQIRSQSAASVKNSASAVAPCGTEETCTSCMEKLTRHGNGSQNSSKLQTISEWTYSRRLSTQQQSIFSKRWTFLHTKSLLSSWWTSH